jgi:hypothetical protein
MRALKRFDIGVPGLAVNQAEDEFKKVSSA